MASNENSPIDSLIELYASLLRQGTSVSIDEFVARYPNREAELRQVLYAVDMVERAALQSVVSSSSDNEASFRRLEKEIPASFGDFDIVRELGRGGMGIVYVARQRSLKRLVALKVLPSSGPNAIRNRQRFRREAESAASLHHTNIVPVFGTGEENGILYYAMQLIDGVPLNHVIDQMQGNERISPDIEERESSAHNQRHFAPRQAVAQLFQVESKPLGEMHFENEPTSRDVSRSPAIRDTAEIRPAEQSATATVDFVSDQSIPQYSSEVGTQSAFLDTGVSRENPIGAIQPLTTTYFRNVARIVASAASALQYAHLQGILHRDIKPANLLLDRDGTLWITDFGLARPTDITNVTQTGEIVGTLRYMAPEQFQGNADQRTDIYSLGLTLFELLTLRHAVDFAHGKLKYCNASPDAIQPHFDAKSDVPRDLQTICLKACAHDSMQRYQQAREFEEDLRRFLEDRPILARRITPAERLLRWSKRNPALAGLMTLSTILLIAIVVLQAITNQEKQANIAKIQNEYERAEQNVRLKTEALEEARVARQRAENNLQLAMEAFDQVIENVSSRGLAMNSITELDGESELIAFADAELNSADVELLDSVISFFDRFAQENGTNLKLQSANASRRVGDIQYQLGRVDEAEQSYRKAIEYYEAASLTASDESRDLALVEVYTQLVLVNARQGNMAVAIATQQKARQILDRNPKLKASKEGRYALAVLLNNTASFGVRLGAEVRPRPRPPQFFPFRPGFGGEAPNNGPPPGQALRLKREIDSNQEAKTILLNLIKESPETEAYQISLAQNYRDEVRIARLLREPVQAEKALSQAIEILSDLLKKKPDSLLIQFQLAETLGTPVTGRPIEYQRIDQALEICERLIKSQPNIPEYRALRGSLLVRQAALRFGNGRREEAEKSLIEALEYQKSLADQFPDVLIYQITYAQSLQMYAIYLSDRGDVKLALDNIDEALRSLGRFQRKRPQPMMLQGILNRLNDTRSTLQASDASQR